MGITERIKQFLFVTLRVEKYRWLSDMDRVTGKPNCFHPLLIKGKGKIHFGNHVQIGVIHSPNFYSHYSYLEARTKSSEIYIGDNVAINNGFSAVAFSKITIGKDVLFGVNCNIVDTDAHDLTPDKRRNGDPKIAPVTIGNNVFFGSNVSVLKGVTIGNNAVIGSGSVVTSSIPENVVAAGNPARVIRNL